MPGLIHIYKGDGKGKTTAAVGLAIRACGRGKKIVFLQFLKNGTSGEINILNQLDGVNVITNTKPFDFVYKLSDSQKDELTGMQNNNLKKAMKLMEQGQVDVLVADEIFSAYSLGTLDKAMVKKLIFNKNENVELVLTGHEVEETFLEHADYVTNMTKEKHPYDQGIDARIGIEL